LRYVGQMISRRGMQFGKKGGDASSAPRCTAAEPCQKDVHTTFGRPTLY
jgi:hypothetical protein